MNTKTNQTSLLGVLGKTALAVIIMGGGYVAFKNREKITQVTAPARTGIAAWWKRVLDSALGDDFAESGDRRQRLHAAE